MRAGTADGFLMGLRCAWSMRLRHTVAVQLPFTPVVAENIANLEGFRSFSPQTAILVVTAFSGRRISGIFLLNHFCRKVMCGKLAVCLTADSNTPPLPHRSPLPPGARAHDFSLWDCVALADAGVGCRCRWSCHSPLVAENIANLGFLFRRRRVQDL